MVEAGGDTDLMGVLTDHIPGMPCHIRAGIIAGDRLLYEENPHNDNDNFDNHYCRRGFL